MLKNSITMEIRDRNQYNQSIGRYKILSSAAGVGAVITTKWGGFIIPLSISDWKFIQVLSKRIEDRPDDTLQQWQDDSGVEIISDQRFVRFLREKRGLPNLTCFAAIPHVSLNIYNRLDIQRHPMYVQRKQAGQESMPEMFYIPAINFPQWFISGNGELRHIDEWLRRWRMLGPDKTDKNFAPPRDPNRGRGNGQQQVFDLLKPVPMVLICPNGHISDIPWYKYFCARLDDQRVDDPNGFDLFGYQGKPCPSGGHHELQWIENRNQSESWGTLKCKHCGQTVSMAGIMNIKPFCQGERPWTLQNQKEQCRNGNSLQIMRMALVTSNSIYYANSQSSLYIPEEFMPVSSRGLSPEAMEMLRKIEENGYPAAVQKQADLTKMDYWDKQFNVLQCSAELEGRQLTADDWDRIKRSFLQQDDQPEVRDILLAYREDEFHVFAGKNKAEHADLNFSDITLPDSLKAFFAKIQTVETLAITTVQLGFSRVSMPTPQIKNNVVCYPNEQVQPIYAESADEVRALPANRLYGEGLFFMFDSDKVNEWSKGLDDYYRGNLPEDDMGRFMADEMDMYGRAKFYLLHTFSHLIMKELEFTCGYTTASLCERLYYSDQMCGVLIYTAEGAEGSMGGLVWQGQPHLIERIMKSALHRALNCSSDPMCWENEDGLNRAACFSCAMVSETSCERYNLGLDRRALVDPEFGFFRDLL